MSPPNQGTGLTPFSTLRLISGWPLLRAEFVDLAGGVLGGYLLSILVDSAREEDHLTALSKEDLLEFFGGSAEELKGALASLERLGVLRMTNGRPGVRAIALDAQLRDRGYEGDSGGW